VDRMLSVRLSSAARASTASITTMSCGGVPASRSPEMRASPMRPPPTTAILVMGPTLPHARAAPSRSAGPAPVPARPLGMRWRNGPDPQRRPPHGGHSGSASVGTGAAAAHLQGTGGQRAPPARSGAGGAVSCCGSGRYVMALRSSGPQVTPRPTITASAMLTQSLDRRRSRTMATRPTITTTASAMATHGRSRHSSWKPMNSAAPASAEATTCAASTAHWATGERSSEAPSRVASRLRTSASSGVSAPAGVSVAAAAPVPGVPVAAAAPVPGPAAVSGVVAPDPAEVSVPAGASLLPVAAAVIPATPAPAAAAPPTFAAVDDDASSSVASGAEWEVDPEPDGSPHPVPGVVGAAAAGASGAVFVSAVAGVPASGAASSPGSSSEDLPAANAPAPTAPAVAAPAAAAVPGTPLDLSSDVSPAVEPEGAASSLRLRPNSPRRPPLRPEPADSVGSSVLPPAGASGAAPARDGAPRIGAVGAPWVGGVGAPWLDGVGAVGAPWADGVGAVGAPWLGVVGADVEGADGAAGGASRGSGVCGAPAGVDLVVISRALVPDGADAAGVSDVPSVAPSPESASTPAPGSAPAPAADACSLSAASSASRARRRAARPLNTV